MNRPPFVAALALACAMAAASVRAQEPSIAVVLERAGEYVTSFQRQLSGVVAEETYVQDVRDPIPSGTVPRAPMRGGPIHRELKSDLLLVKPEKADRWIQFRDVFEVDGKAIRDRSERLMKLFVEPTAATADRAEQIVTESARYNIGNVVRTINVPVFALLILDPRNQDRFKFSRADKGGPAIGMGRDLAVPDSTWVIRYEETGHGTLIATSLGRDLPSRGRFWIDPDNRPRVDVGADRRGPAGRRHGHRAVPTRHPGRPAGAGGDARAVSRAPQQRAHRRRRNLREVSTVSSEGGRENRAHQGEVNQSCPRDRPGRDISRSAS